MALNVICCSSEYLGVVLELAESEIAGVAEQPAYLSGGVVVVDGPGSASGPRLVCSTYGAPSVLLGKKFVVPLFGDAQQSKSAQPRRSRVVLSGRARRSSVAVLMPLSVVRVKAWAAIGQRVSLAFVHAASELADRLGLAADRAPSRHGQNDIGINRQINVTAVVWL